LLWWFGGWDVGTTHAVWAGLAVISTGSISNVQSSISRSPFLLSCIARDSVKRRTIMKIVVFRHVTTCSLVDCYQHFGGSWWLTLQVKQDKVQVRYDRRLVGQSIFVARTHLRPETRLLLLSHGYEFLHVVRCLWWEDRCVVHNYCWSSPAQSFLGPNPARFMTMFYCLRFETPPWRRGRSSYFCPPRTRWPSYNPRHWVQFSSLPTTRRATVEVFEPTSTRTNLHSRSNME
jgi:hypothetical protein